MKPSTETGASRRRHLTLRGSRPTPRPDPPARGVSARHNRVAVLTVFVTFGVLAGSWLSRVPDVKLRLEIDDARWGLLATCGSIGSLVSMTVAAAVISQVGPRRLSRVAVVLLLVCAPMQALAPTVGWLGTAMVGWGLSASLLQAPINSAGIVVERRYGRPVMNGFHAGWSVGALLGGLAGSLAARLGVTPGRQFLLTVALLGVAVAATTRWLPPDEPVPHRARPGFTLTPQLCVLALTAFCTAVAEGTTSGWAGIYLTETLHAGPAAGALAYTCFAASMTVGRLFGDRVLDRLGHQRFLRFVPLLAVVGIVAGLAAGNPPAAFAGFCLAGLGLSGVNPTVFAAAGNQPGVPSGQAIATVATASWPAFLAGPPLVGAIAEATSLRTGLLVVGVAAGAVSLLSTLVRVPTRATAG